MGIIEKVFGTYSDKELKRIIPIAHNIDALEPEMQKLTDEQLRGKTVEFRKRYENGESLDNIMTEAYAVVREAVVRVYNQRLYHVQLIAGIVLHQGRIAEMRTGEGKTHMSLLPAYLNSLTGKGVHIVTVNDYLAKRDCEWMGQVYQFLGVTCGVVLHDLDNDERRDAYACDVTYATNNELGFDYLRDNMVVYEKDMVQRDLNYVVIDEVDSILIDEARTPLIISGSSGKSTMLYTVADVFAKTLTKGRIINEEAALNPLMREELQEEGDFVVDEKQKTVNLTQEGITKAEHYFKLENLSDPENLEIQHHINNALKANYNMYRDKDYVVNENEVVIVDEFTGRLMPGRRYSDGLHQAIEAKEGVEVNRESRTLATITFQNFFNRYVKKSGMTGTALTEEGEFRHIYSMDVVVIPTNKVIKRVDLSDVVYKTEAAKFRAVVDDIVECYGRGQPVLVGTITIEKSEELSEMLKKKSIPHTVLNAKYHAKEAEIVAQAGIKNAVTIATNMAGRGTDIKLGEGVPELGGLKIIGTERHESRRIDNQLRGRSGRQGDPGSSRFYISLDDDLMRLFGSDRVKKVVETLGMNEDDPIEHGMLSKAIENAQKRVESNHFAARKHLLDYDRVMNEQREIIYDERRKVLAGADLREQIIKMIGHIVTRAVDKTIGDEQYTEDWDMLALNEILVPVLSLPTIKLGEDDKDLKKDILKERITAAAVSLYEKKEAEIEAFRNSVLDEEIRSKMLDMRELERRILLMVIDRLWMNHIDDMDQMRHGIGLRAYAQRDPIVEYKFISYDMFEELSNNIQSDTVRSLLHVRIEKVPEKREQVAKPVVTNKEPEVPKAPKIRKTAKIGRNDPCPCGSGKKFKQCHGRLETTA